MKLVVNLLVVNLLESDPLSSYPCGYLPDPWTCFDQATIAVPSVIC